MWLATALRPAVSSADSTTVAAWQGCGRAVVAIPADISVEHYSKLERNSIPGAPEDCPALDQPARQLDAEQAYPFDHCLRREDPGGQTPTCGRTGRRESFPACSGRWTRSLQCRHSCLTAERQNGHSGREFSGKAFSAGVSPPLMVKLPRFSFHDPERSQIFYLDWDAAADLMRSSCAPGPVRDAHTKDRQDLVGELSPA